MLKDDFGRFSLIAKWVQYFIEQKIENSTFKSYKSAWNVYLKFCNEFNINALPITQDKMMFYTSYRALRRKFGTVKKDAYALQYITVYLWILIHGIFTKQ